MVGALLGLFGSSRKTLPSVVPMASLPLVCGWMAMAEISLIPCLSRVPGEYRRECLLHVPFCLFQTPMSPEG